jgi:hypothetical protein
MPSRSLRALFVATVTCVVLAPVAAWSQTASSGPPALPPPPPGATADAATLSPMQVTASTCPSDAVYQQAFQRFGDGLFDEAHDLATRVVHDCPNHPYAAELLRQSDIRIAAGQHIRPPAMDEATRRQHALYGPEDPGDLARPELVLVQGLHGAYQGVFLCLGVGAATSSSPFGSNNCSAAWAIGSGLLGAGIFGAVAFFATNRSLRTGQATVINSGSLWGLVNGGLALFITGASPGTMSGVFVASGLIGTGAGAVIAALAPPTAGHVGMANSLALWTGGITGLLLADAATHPSNGLGPGGVAGTLMAAIDGGLLIGAIVGSRYRVTRGRMLIADLGALLGGVLGAGLGGLISLATNAADPTFIGGALGIGGGFVTAVLLTHSTDYPAAARVHSSIVPIGPTGGPGMSAMVTF